MNGYEGDLKEHLRRNPDALFRTQRSLSQSSPLTTNPLLAYNSHRQNYSPSPSLPYSRQNQDVSSSYKSVYSSSVAPPTYTTEHGHNTPNHSSKTAIPTKTTLSTSDVWERKDASSLHPAIRQEYGTMFYHQYQPPYKKSQASETLQNANQATYQTQPAQQQPTQAPTAQSQQIPPSASQAATVFAQTYQALQGQQFDDNKPLYPHQQYFQSSQNQRQPDSHVSVSTCEVPDVPVDSSTLIEKMMANLRQASRQA